MERIRRVGCSAILSDLVKKGIKEGRDEERMESMNVVPDKVVGQKEEKNMRAKGDNLKRAMKATKAARAKVVNREIVKRMRDEVSDWREWKSIDCSVIELVIAAKCCNEGVKEVNLGKFVSLKVFEVGDECFENVEEVKMIGLNQLERVLIGQKCFTKSRYGQREYDPNRHFYLKNCERVRELWIGCSSFIYYSVCEIENVPSLEVIEMGELKEDSYNFIHASLDLKSDCERMK